VFQEVLFGNKKAGPFSEPAFVKRKKKMSY
jgi:hypothetical protein